MVRSSFSFECALFNSVANHNLTLCPVRKLRRGGLWCNRQCDHHRQLLQRLVLCWRHIRRRPHRQRLDVQGQSRQIKQEFAKIVEKQVEGEVRDGYGFVPDPDYLSRTDRWTHSKMITAAYFTCEYMFTARSKRRPDSRKASKSFFSIFPSFV